LLRVSFRWGDGFPAGGHFKRKRATSATRAPARTATLVGLGDAGSTMLWMVLWLLMALRAVWRWLLRPRAPLCVARTRVDQKRAFQPSVNQRKPDWVRHELIRLRAWSPHLGCRKIADAFNRRYELERCESVSKSYVAQVLRKHAHEVTRLQRTVKHRVPREIPRQRIWALDLTAKADLTGTQRLMLGLLDHGTRACVSLSTLTDKRSLTILRELLVVFRRFGLPRTLRVDNEACLVSRIMCVALRLLGVRLQRTDPHCPWQNGRIERLFGTLKAMLAQIAITGPDDLTVKLVEFRAWYNHARPHQHLANRTPAEAWDGRDRSTRAPWLMCVWDGALTGWYFPP
jgi:transposase InsO family protein